MIAPQSNHYVKEFNFDLLARSWYSYAVKIENLWDFGCKLHHCHTQRNGTFHFRI